MSKKKNNNNRIRLISDLHGDFRKYLPLVKEANDLGMSTIQMGDFGFNYDILRKLPTNNYYIGGNHEHWGILRSENAPNNFLGLYGTLEQIAPTWEELAAYQNTFFMSGAFSIDYKYRIRKEESGAWPKTWWAEEELSYEEMEGALQLYIGLKPDVVLTHDAPSYFSKYFSSRDTLTSFGFDPDNFHTRTQECLDRMWESHKPKQWFVAHFHKSYHRKIDGCNFRLLNINEHYDLEL